MEAATQRIVLSLKGLEQNDRKGRLAAVKKVFRSVWELRCALREIRSLSSLRANAAQAKAWDAIELVLSCKQLIVSEALRGSLCEAVVLLYAAGDAGGQLYACYRGLHELCGDEKKSLVGRSSSARSVGSRCASCEALGALCAAYGPRLGSPTLAEARSRLARRVSRATNEGSLRASALRALADVTSASSGLSSTLKSNAASGMELVKLVANRANSEKSSAARSACARLLAAISRRASVELLDAVASFAAAAAEEAGKMTEKNDPKKKDDSSKKAAQQNGGGTDADSATAGRRSPNTKKMSSGATTPPKPQQQLSKQLRIDHDSAAALVDAVFELGAKWLGDECLEARTGYARAVGIAASARIEAAIATRERLSAASARADEADGQKGVDNSSPKPPLAPGAAGKRSIADRVMGSSSASSSGGGGVTARRSGGKHQTVETFLKWAATSMAKAASDGNRKTLSGLSACACVLIDSQRSSLRTKESLEKALRALLSPEPVLLRSSSQQAATSAEHVDALRAANAFVLRDGFCKVCRSDRARRDLLVASLDVAATVQTLSNSSPLAAELCLSLAAHLVDSLGSAIPADVSNSAEKAALDLAKAPGPGVRGRAVDLAVALAENVRQRRASLTRRALRLAMEQHLALVDVAVSSPSNTPRRRLPPAQQNASSRMARPVSPPPAQRAAAARARDGLDGYATVVSALVYGGGGFSSHDDGLPWSLQDEILAVGESLVTRQFDATLFRDVQGTTALVCCVRSGWAIVGSLASDSSFVNRRVDRIVHALDRGLDFDQDDEDKLDANHQLACLEAALGAVAKLQAALPDHDKIPSMLGRVVESTVRIGRSATPRLYRLVAAATLEVYASLPSLRGLPDPELSNAFRWALTLFKEVAAPLDNVDGEGGQDSFSMMPQSSSGDDDEDEDEQLATTTTLSFLVSHDETDDFEILGVAHRADGNGVGDEAAASALAAARLGASDSASAALAISYLSPKTRSVLQHQHQQSGGGGGLVTSKSTLSAWLRKPSHSCALPHSATSTSRQRQQKVTSQLVAVRLVDAVVRCMSTLAPSRRPETQSQALELVSATLVAALQAAQPKAFSANILTTSKQADDDLRKRERRHAVAAVNASACLLALVSSLDSWSADHFTDSPRDALARGLASASPRVRRFSAVALSHLVSKLPPDDKKNAAIRALFDAASKSDAPRSGPDSSRRSGAACAVAFLAENGNLKPDLALEALRKPLADATASARGHPVPRAWILVSLARLIRTCYSTRRQQMSEPTARQLVGAILDLLETQVTSAANPELRAGCADDDEDAQDLSLILKRSASADRLSGGGGGSGGGSSSSYSAFDGAAYAQHWTNALGVEDASIAYVAVGRCLAALGPLMRRRRLRGPDAPLAQRYAALLDAVLSRADDAGGIESPSLNRAALSAYAAVAPSFLPPEEEGDDQDDRFALLKAHSLCACLGAASRVAHAPSSLAEAAAAIRCLRALVVPKATAALETSSRGDQPSVVAELVARTVKLASLSVLDSAVVAKAAHPLCCDGKRRAEASDAAGVAGRALSGLVDNDSADREYVAWLLLPCALNALAEEDQESSPQQPAFSVLLGGWLFCRRRRAETISVVVDRLADDAYPADLFAADQLDDGLAPRSEAAGGDSDEEEDDFSSSSSVAAFQTRAAVLESARRDAGMGLELALGRQPSWRVKETALRCATQALRRIKADRHFDMVAARQIVDDFRAAAANVAAKATTPGAAQSSSEEKSSSESKRQRERRLERVASAAALLRKQRRSVPDLVALRLDEIVGLACSAAAATIGDDAPLDDLRTAGIDLLRLVVDRFASTPDPEGGLALAQYTSQLASAMRATLGPSSSLSVVAKAGDLFVQIARVSLLDDPTQARRLVKLHLTPALKSPTVDKASIRPHRDDETLPAHSVLLDHIDRLATLAHLALLASTPSSGGGDEGKQNKSKQQPYFYNFGPEAPIVDETLAPEARRALSLALDEASSGADWRGHWIASCLDGARLSQGVGSWPSMDAPRLSVGKLYDSGVDASKLREALHRYMPLFVEAASSSPPFKEDEDDALLAMAIGGLATEQSSSRTTSWLGAVEALLSRRHNAAAEDALVDLADRLDESLLPALVRASKDSRCAVTALRRLLVVATYEDRKDSGALWACLDAAGRVDAVSEDLLALAVAAARLAPASNDDCVRAATSPRAVLSLKPDANAALVALAADRFQLFSEAGEKIAASAAAAVLEPWLAGVRENPSGVHRSSAYLARLALLPGAFPTVIAPLLPPSSTRTFDPALSEALVAAILPAAVVSASRRQSPHATVAILATSTRCTDGAKLIALAVSSAKTLDGVVAEALLSLARLNAQLFRDAVCQLSPDAKTKVETAVRAAATTKTTAPPSRRPGPFSSSSAAGGAARPIPAAAATSPVKKIDMTRYH